MPARNKPLRVLVVDDERLARNDLVALLKQHAGIGAVSEAATLVDAERSVKQLDPDVVFLDIRLGESSGFQLLDVCDDRHVVFVTAYDEYAVKAFETNALDYLLKPVSADRLDMTLARLREEGETAHVSGETEQLGPDNRLFLRLDEEWSFVRIGDIVAIHADGKESIVDFGMNRRRRARKSLAHWAARLPIRQFVRVHRSTLVQVAMVERVSEWSHYSFHVHLRGVEQPVVMSRRHAARLKDVLG